MSGLVKFWDRFEEWVVAFLMLALTVVTFSNVVARISGSNILWAKELTQNIFAWLVIFGASYCVRESAHIGIDAFVKRLTPETRHRTSIAAAFFCLLFALICLIGGTEAFIEEYRLDIEMEDMKIKEWVFKSILPIGFALLSIRCAEVLYKLVTGKMQNMEMADEGVDVLDESIRSDELVERAKKS